MQKSTEKHVSTGGSNTMLAAGTLLEFLDDNLEKSKNEKGSNPLFMAGWIAALMHVKVNYLQQLNSDSACR